MKKFIIIITLVLYTKNISDILTKLSLRFSDGAEGVILFDILNAVLLNVLVTTPNNEDSEKRLKTAINIPFSPYEYIRMPFSLTNVPALHGRSPARIGILFHIYKNDVLVAYPDHEKHSEYIVKALSRWKRNCSYKPVVTTVNDSRSSTRSLSAFHPVSCYVTGTAVKIEI
ncbi:hypothetical protein T4A_9625 [Trichinella pseudospiralis]|uniref:Uncharacterized protein n=2 Tax=Trichinella pseudospiralis TaxID=6337 RepID=A0A0V1DU21_TRIPS|nr:hypothetical protein T4A_9625 [Trichinella pseudospiralis]